MQFTQTGFPRYGPPFTFNTPFQCNGYPEIIGEGNVSSMMSPDGSMQLLFVPTAQWWQPIHSGFDNLSWPSTGAWFIRRVFSPLQPTNFNQTFPASNCTEFRRTFSSDCFVNTPPAPACAPNFELKFHNDICTSTSDIHYFYPSLRPYCNWLQNSNACAPVQDVPMTTNCASHYEIFCTKPCNCTPTNERSSSEKSKCSCGKTSNTSVSGMSCETDKSEENCCHNKGKQKQTLQQKKSKKNQKHKIHCECKREKKTDKSVTTYADQACGSVAEKGRKTQTSCGDIPLRKATSGDLSEKQADTELWMPKTPMARRAMKIKSSEHFKGVCESGCCSGTCSCHSDTD